jgi:hypothetical protein
MYLYMFSCIYLCIYAFLHVFIMYVYAYVDAYPWVHAFLCAYVLCTHPHTSVHDTLRMHNIQRNTYLRELLEVFVRVFSLPPAKQAYAATPDSPLLLFQIGHSSPEQQRCPPGSCWQPSSDCLCMHQKDSLLGGYMLIDLAVICSFHLHSLRCSLWDFRCLITWHSACVRLKISFVYWRIGGLGPHLQFAAWNNC